MRNSLAFGAALVGACASGGGPTANTPTMTFPVTDQRELLPDEQVQHVLNRLAFGGRPGDAAAVRAMGVDKWIARQLDPRSIDDSKADAVVGRYTSLSSNRAELTQAYGEVRQARQQ